LRSREREEFIHAKQRDGLKASSFTYKQRKKGDILGKESSLTEIGIKRVGQGRIGKLAPVKKLASEG